MASGDYELMKRMRELSNTSNSVQPNPYVRIKELEREVAFHKEIAADAIAKQKEAADQRFKMAFQLAQAYHELNRIRNEKKLDKETVSE